MARDHVNAGGGALAAISTVLLLSACWPAARGAATGGDLCPSQAALGGADAMLVGLLALHRGPSCDEVRIKSLQQTAAAQLVIKDINEADHSDGLTIGLHIMDTCSDTKHAVRMAFKALVFSDTNICKKSPLFLGFLGPDGGEELDAVQKITSVFKLSHATPLSLPGHQLEVANPFHVAIVRPAEKIRAMLQLLKQVRWTALSIVHSPDADSSLLATSLLSASHKAGPCIAEVRQLPAEGTLVATLPTVGVLVIAPPERFADLLRYSSSTNEPHSFIFVANEAGILPSLFLSNDLSSSILVMQETSNQINELEQQLAKSPLWDEYLYQQRCNFSTCGNADTKLIDYALIQDPSVVPLMQAVKLYSRALRIAHKLKCAGRPGRCSALNKMPPEEWRGILGSASDKGVRFQMDQRSSYKLFFKAPFSRGLDKVGNITDAGRQVSLDPIQLPESHYALCNEDELLSDVSGFPALMRPTPPLFETTRVPPVLDRQNPVRESPPGKDDEAPDSTTKTTFFGGSAFDMFNLGSYSTVEVVGILVGIGCGIALIFVLLIYAIYSIFRVKGNDERSRNGSSRRSSVRST